MTTFSIVEDASVGASGVSAGDISDVKDIILAAAETWNRYFVQAAFDIKIELKFADIAGSTLATGGSGLSFSGFGGAGLEVWKVDSMEEYITGGEVEGSAVDITITVDTPLLLAGDFFFDPAPFTRSAAVPGGKNDFMSVMLHELGHGFGFLSFSDDGMDTIDDSGAPADAPDIAPFDMWVDPDAPGGRSFVGPSAKALFGGDIILDPGSSSHIAKVGDGGFENLMDPSLLTGSRSYVAPIHIAMLDDIGFPTRKATAGADTLFGFDALGDSISLLGGADVYDGLSGADTVRGGDGNDSIRGGAGDDKLFGDLGKDTLRGDAGADKLFGGGGNDRLIGGGGNDSLFGNANADRLEGDGGADAFRGFGGNDRLFGGDGADSLLGHTGNDIINGGNQRDIIDAGAANDQLFGDGGSDVLFGRAGNDTMKGGGGGDEFFGGTGSDRITGGAGNDTMSGNGGNDFFIYEPGDDADTIKDFTAGAGTQDKIDLSAMGASFDTFSEVLAVTSNVSGNAVIDFGGGNTITLTSVTKASLDADDFIF